MVVTGALVIDDGERIEGLGSLLGVVWTRVREVNNLLSMFYYETPII